MNEVIVAISNKGGLGFEGKIPWRCKRDLALFREKTMGKRVIVGRVTEESLPTLSGRDMYCLTRTLPEGVTAQGAKVIRSFEEVEEPVCIAGGAQIYQEALRRPNYVGRVHLSIIETERETDVKFDMGWLRDFLIVESQIFKVQGGEPGFHYYLLERTVNGERQYLDLLKQLCLEAPSRQGRNGEVRSLFGKHFTFDLRNGFPLLTTKKMFMRGIVEEFLFFLRGDTDTSYLSERNVKIWEGNTSAEFLRGRDLEYAEGVMGPMYGYQWRNFGAPYELDDSRRPKDTPHGIDQLQNVVKLITSDPGSRRILMTTYNPSQVEEGVLYPCHSIIIQFYVQDSNLDMFCFNRSQDTFLGVPYNIASSALLLMVVAELTGKNPRYLKMTMGDTHLYQSHLQQANEQRSRIPLKFPELVLPPLRTLEDIKELTAKEFILKKYQHHPSIRAAMVV